MDIKYIRRCSLKKSPMVKAIDYARFYGFKLQREPFGKRGSLIELYRDKKLLGYRKSYRAILNLMKSIRQKQCINE